MIWKSSFRLVVTVRFCFVIIRELFKIITGLVRSPLRVSVMSEDKISSSRSLSMLISSVNVNASLERKFREMI